MDSKPPAQSSKPAAVGLAAHAQHRPYRHQMQTLAYFNVEQDNGGIIHNLGEAGLAVQAVARLTADHEVFLRFDLANPRVRVEAKGRVAWTEPTGRAGIEFLAISQRSRRALREWIFVQLLTLAHQAAQDLILVNGERDEGTAELLFSTSARPAIHFEPLAEERSIRTRSVHLPWLPFGISAPVLSRLVDGLILLSAVLLFAVICMAMLGTVPAWPIALIFGFGVTGIFALLYRFLFSFWIGGTPGNFLARLMGDHGMNLEVDDRPRFR